MHKIGHQKLQTKNNTPAPRWPGFSQVTPAPGSGCSCLGSLMTPRLVQVHKPGGESRAGKRWWGLVLAPPLIFQKEKQSGVQGPVWGPRASWSQRGALLQPLSSRRAVQPTGFSSAGTRAPFRSAVWP